MADESAKRWRLNSWLCSYHYELYREAAYGIRELPPASTIEKLHVDMWIRNRLEIYVNDSGRYERAKQSAKDVRFTRDAVADRIFELLKLPVCCTVPTEVWAGILVEYKLKFEWLRHTAIPTGEPQISRYELKHGPRRTD